MKNWSDTGIDTRGKNSGEIKTTCPQCSHTRKKSKYPCLNVNLDKQIWHCHHCGWSGSLKQGEYQRPEIKKTYRKPTVTPKTSGLPEKVLQWFADRGIKEEVLKRNAISNGMAYFPQVEEERGCIMFPYRRKGEVINIKYRTHDKLFRMEGGCERILYGIDDIQETLYWVEGECFPGDAEVLTPDGWVRFDAYKDQPVAQVTNDLSIEMVAPLASIRKQFDGDLVRFEKGGNYLSVTTPGHNLVIEIGGKLTKRQAGDIPKNIPGRVPRAGVMHGSGISLSDDQLRFCIAVHADASVRDDGRYRSRYAVFGFKKARKISRLTEIMGRLNLKFSHTKIANGYDSICLHLPDWVIGKSFPMSWLFDATQHQREVILDELIEWDGNRVKDRPQTEFASSKISEAVFVQTLAHLSGRVATIHKRKNEHGEWFKVNILNNKRSTFWQFMEPTPVPHCGDVYCVTVPSGMLLIRQGDHITITGNCDKLSVEMAGITSCVSVPDGAPAPDSKSYETKFDFLDAPELAQVKTHVIAVDNDPPGLRLREELIRRLGPEKCKVVDWPDGCKDANDVLKNLGVDALIGCLNDARELPIIGAYSVTDFEADVHRLYREGVPKGLSTGWECMNEYYNVRAGDVTVVTGAPNSGKSEFLDAMIVNIARIHEWRFGIYSPEQGSPAEHISKIIEKYTGYPFNPGPTERIPLAKLDQALEWSNDRFTWMLPEEPSLDAILKVAAQLVLRRGARGVVLDPWNEIEHNRPREMSETEYVGVCLSRIRKFAKSHQVHVWIVAHPQKLQRNIETGQYPVAGPYEISGSANWHNKPDACLSIWRERTDDKSKTEVEIHIQKVRHKYMGRIGMVKLNWDRVSGRYYEQPASKPTPPKEKKPPVKHYQDKDKDDSWRGYEQ